jgi:signal peptidase I
VTATLKKLWKNEYVQTAVIIGSIILIVVGLWFGIQVTLNTPYPALAVVSGSMCIPQDADCNGWTHPFERTLHIGDLIIIQGVNPADLNANYPNSDIIVYYEPNYPYDPDHMIVHRIVSKEVSENGTIYFTTKGDGNSQKKWPETPDETDPWCPVSQNLVVGKVVMHIPWVGHAVLFMRNSVGLPIIIALMVILVVIEFILPLLKKKAPVAKPEQPERNTTASA